MDYKKAFYTMGNEWFSGKSGLKANWAKFLPADQIITPNQAIENVIEHANIDWTNPNLKICDPCCGSGRFLIYCLIKLLEAGHSEKHIIENMLYGTEVSPECIDFIERFWKFNRYKHNIKSSSILKDDWSYNNMYFDLIIMNPPFKEPKLPGAKRSGKNLDVRIWDICLSKHPKQMYSIMSDTSSRSNSHKYTFREPIEAFEGVTIATAIVGYTPDESILVQAKKANLLDKRNWININRINAPKKSLKDFYKPCTRKNASGKVMFGMGYKGVIPANCIGIAERSSCFRFAKPGEILMTKDGKRECETTYLFDFNGYDLTKIITLLNTLETRFADYTKAFEDYHVCRGFWECIEIPDEFKL